jgi:hypothetical protein
MRHPVLKHHVQRQFKLTGLMMMKATTTTVSSTSSSSNQPPAGKFWALSMSVLQVCYWYRTTSIHHCPSWETNRCVVTQEISGRATAQAVSHWLPTAAAWVCAWVSSSGFCCGQSGAEAGFLWVLRFPLPIFIPPNSPSSQPHRAGTIGQKWPMYRVDPLWTPPPIKWKLLKKFPDFYVTCRSITTFTRAWQWYQWWPKWIHITKLSLCFFNTWRTAHVYRWDLCLERCRLLTSTDFFMLS